MPALPNRAQCPVCFHSVRVADGVLVAHLRPAVVGDPVACPGSGAPVPQDSAAHRS